MNYKVYSGPVGADPAAPMDKDRMLFKAFASFDEALSWASHIRDTGRVAFLIEDDTGMRFDKRQIAEALGHRDTRDVRGAPAH
jgi:hypothetical protein